MMDILPEHVREWGACMKARGGKPNDDPVRHGGARRHLHHGAERPDHVASPVQGCQDPAGPSPAAHCFGSPANRAAQVSLVSGDARLTKTPCGQSRR